MAYNYFPTNYQPVYYPQSNPYPAQGNAYQAQPNNYQAPQNTQQNSPFIWVQGEAGAKSYLVAPNTTVQLWDSENKVIYLKSADASGMPSMKIIDYEIREPSQPAQQPIMNSEQAYMPNNDYVTRDELSAFEEQIREQIARLTPAKKSAPKKEEKPDE